MTDTPFPALTRAAEAAIAYRRDVAAAERTPVASYAAMLDAFAGRCPRPAAMAKRSSPSWSSAATPGIRASTGARFFAG